MTNAKTREPSILRRLAVFCGAAVFAFATWLAVGEDQLASLPRASEWAGKFWSSEKPNLYQNPTLRKAAIDLLGTKQFQETILKWGIAPAVITDGDALMAQGCMPHNCPNYNQATLIDDGEVKICIFRDETLYWYVPGRRAPLTRASRGGSDGGCMDHRTVADARAELARMAGN